MIDNKHMTHKRPSKNLTLVCVTEPGKQIPEDLFKKILHNHHEAMCPLVLTKVKIDNKVYLFVNKDFLDGCGMDDDSVNGFHSLHEDHSLDHFEE